MTEITCAGGGIHPLALHPSPPPQFLRVKRGTAVQGRPLGNGAKTATTPG